MKMNESERNMFESLKRRQMFYAQRGGGSEKLFAVMSLSQLTEHVDARGKQADRLLAELEDTSLSATSREWKTKTLKSITDDLVLADKAMRKLG